MLWGRNLFFIFVGADSIVADVVSTVVEADSTVSDVVSTVVEADSIVSDVVSTITEVRLQNTVIYYKINERVIRTYYGP
jgi:hypothetical protein